MGSPRDVLNRIRWDDHDGRGLGDVRVFYLHRGAPDDTAVLEGRDILDVGRSFLDLPEGARLPMHRILRIEHAGRTVWDRRRDARPHPEERT